MYHLDLGNAADHRMHAGIALRAADWTALKAPGKLATVGLPRKRNRVARGAACAPPARRTAPGLRHSSVLRIVSNARRPDAPPPVAYAPLRVALLEDDDVLRERVLLPGLQRHGFEVIALRTIRALLALLRSASVELIVLDIGLPDGDGFGLTRQLQAMRPALGIVILSGRGDQPDRLRGLSQGADAYLVKPVEIEMLAATLFSVARRLPRGAADAPSVPATAAPDAWQLQDDGWCLFAPDGSAVPLTGSERLVLQCLWQSSGRLVSRSALLTALGGSLGIEIDPHRLDALLHRLRHKVLERSGTALPLTSVRGAGYLLMPQVRAPTAGS